MWENVYYNQRRDVYLYNCMEKSYNIGGDEEWMKKRRI